MSLKELPKIAVLSPLVTRILGLNPGKYTLQGTNTYLIGSGKTRILLDTGDGRDDYAELLKNYLDLTGIEISTVLVSHWHPDHVGGLKNITGLQKLQNASYWKSKHHTDNQAIDYKWIEDGQQFPLEGGATLTAHYTPGHASDHFVFWLDKESVLFSADNVLGEGTTVFEDLSLYISSLRKMNDIGTSNSLRADKNFVIFPGHGPLISNGSAKILEYIQHRQQRENEIVSVLSRFQKPVEVEQIVNTIYTDLPEEKYGAALRGIRLHLDKLQLEKRVASLRDDYWELVGGGFTKVTERL